jgi:hypothetical protein
MLNAWLAVLAWGASSFGISSPSTCDGEVAAKASALDDGGAFRTLLSMSDRPAPGGTILIGGGVSLPTLPPAGLVMKLVGDDGLEPPTSCV